MKMAEAVMRVAREHGLRHFFGIPGGGTPLDLIEAGRKLGVSFVNMGHESSAAIAAAYYGLTKQTTGLAMSIRGVGAANMVGGVANAYFERLPLVVICESAGTAKWESIQQCDQHQFFEGVAGYQSILTSDGGVQMIREAFSHAMDGRPSPSILHFPANVSEAEDNQDSPHQADRERSLIDESALGEIKKFLAGIHRPAILAGADVVRSDATGELFRLIENIGAAVLVTMEARGVFPESHPRWAGVFWGLFNPETIESRVLRETDGILLVGVDAMMTHSPWKSGAPTCELVARPQYSTMSSPALRVNGDLKILLKRLNDHRPKPGFSEDEVRALRADILRYFKRPPSARFAAQDVLEIAREILPPEGLLISETGAFVCMLEQLWRVDRWGDFIATSGGRSMGLMIPGVLGSRLADPNRPIMGLGADGSLLMRLGELEVFARTGVNVPLVIINDQALGTMKSRQRSRRLPDYGLDFHDVDFARVAQSCGLYGVTVETPEALSKELRKAMQADKTTLIDARVDPQPYQDSFGPTIGVLD